MLDTETFCEFCQRPLNGSSLDGPDSACSCAPSDALAEEAVHIGDRGILPEADAASSPEVLGVEIAFHCRRCEASLAVDFQWQGRLVQCPSCDRMIEVPQGAAAQIQVAVSMKPAPHQRSRLSPEEVAFLSELEIGS
jgi:hypothetical protein